MNKTRYKNTLNTLRTKNWHESILKYVCMISAICSIIITFSIIVLLVSRSIGFFREVSIVEFFTARTWNPTIKPASFGIRPLLSGTIVFTFLTACISIPIGLFTAIFLGEYVGPKFHDTIKSFLELLAGLPTVVYGYFALVYITPLIQKIFPSTETFNILSAAIVVAIMIIPTIASISEDAIKAVPVSLRYASYALGANERETCLRVVLPSAFSGIMSSFILGISRAIGETMAVTIAAGNLARIVNVFDIGDTLLKPIQTMTAAMVEIGISDVTGDSTAYKSLFAIGLVLFIITLIMNIYTHHLKSKVREVYE